MMREKWVYDLIRWREKFIWKIKSDGQENLPPRDSSDADVTVPVPRNGQALNARVMNSYGHDLNVRILPGVGFLWHPGYNYKSSPKIGYFGVFE